MISLERLAFRLKNIFETNFAGSQLIDVQAIAGGASGLTYLARVQGGRLPSQIVIKVAPPGVAPIGHRDVLRQARILKSLSSIEGITVPKVIFEDFGDPPDTPPLYAMQCIVGVAFEPNKDVLLPDHALPPPDMLTERAVSAAQMLATLHLQSLTSLGLQDDTAFTPQDELERWHRLIMKADKSIQSEANSLIDRLAADVPTSLPPTLLHGDFRLGNLLCRDNKIAAIVDWEIWAVGDQRTDLAWFLLTAEPSVHPLAIRSAPGMPPASKLLDVYKGTFKDIEKLEWFRALALLKMAASTALISRNNLRVGDPAGHAARFMPLIPIMLERAQASLH